MEFLHASSEVAATALATVKIPRGSAVVAWLPCAGGVILCPQRASKCLARVPLADGAAVLVASAGTGITLSGAGLASMPLPGIILRLLAFHDHGNEIHRAPPAPGTRSVHLVLPHRLNSEKLSRDWLLTQIVQPNPAFEAVAAQLAQNESYRIVRFVQDNASLNVQQLGDRYGLSAAQFRRLARVAFGRPLKEQLRLLRASRALQLYVDTGMTFTQVASELGYSSPSHFCSEIRSLLGQSPRSLFRAKQLP